VTNFKDIVIDNHNKRLLEKYPNATSPQIQMAELSEKYWRNRISKEYLAVSEYPKEQIAEVIKLGLTDWSVLVAADDNLS